MHKVSVKVAPRIAELQLAEINRKAALLVMQSLQLKGGR